MSDERRELPAKVYVRHGYHRLLEYLPGGLAAEMVRAGELTPEGGEILKTLLEDERGQPLEEC